MTYFVEQYGEHFFVITKISGFVPDSIIPRTKITKDEYTKLYNSSTQRENMIMTPAVNPRTKGTMWKYRIPGIAAQIIGRPVGVIQ